MKHEGGAQLIGAIRRVPSGKPYVSEQMSARILEGLSGRPPSTQYFVINQLSDRELEIFRLIGRGLSTQQVASQLHLSAKTVDAHRGASKTNLKSRV